MSAPVITAGPDSSAATPSCKVKLTRVAQTCVERFLERALRNHIHIEDKMRRDDFAYLTKPEG